MKTESRPSLKSLLVRRASLTFALAVSMAVLTRGAEINYDGSVTPDIANPPLTWQIGGGASWSVTEGVLEMATTSGGSVWFGNETDFRPVAWKLADSANGNYASARLKLSSGSGGWSFYLADGTHYANFGFNAAFITYETVDGTQAYVNSTTNGFQDYAFRLQAGQVTYWVDGAEIYSGPARAQAGLKYIVLGDGTTAAGFGAGSLFVDKLKVITDAQSLDQTTSTIRVSEVEVCFMAFSDFTYQAQYQSDLLPGAWINEGSAFEGSGDVMCLKYAIPPGEPRRFYRVIKVQ